MGKYGNSGCRLELGDCYIGSSNPVEAGLDSKSGTMPPCLKKILLRLSLIHISEPTRLGMISYAVFCLFET